MRSSLKRLAAFVAAPALLGLVPAVAAAAQATLSCPAMAQTGQQFLTEVTIDVGAPCTMATDCGTGWACVSNKCTTALGAYSITLSYDPTLVTVATVAGGNTTEFQGTPQSGTMCPTANSCQTRLAAFQTSNLNGPTGVVSVAKVTFTAQAAATASIGLAINSLFDTSSNAICNPPGPQSCSATGCAVSIAPAPTTTTTATTSSTTSTTSTTQPSTTSTTTATSTSTTATTSSTTTTTNPSTTTTTSSTTSTTTRPSTTTTSPSTTSSTSTTTTTHPSTTTTTSSTTTTTTRQTLDDHHHRHHHHHASVDHDDVSEHD